VEVIINQVHLTLRRCVLKFFRGRYFVVSMRGAHFLVDIRNYIHRQIEARGGYEDAPVDRFLDEMDEARCNVFVDAGGQCRRLYCFGGKAISKC